MTNEKKPMERCTPESVGIMSEGIYAYIKALVDERLMMHDVLIARYGKICFEGYFQPYKPDFRHRLYSCSKSFTSCAVGILIEEGKLSLEDRCVDFFPDKAPADMHPYLREMTIRDLLMMTTCYSLGASYLPTDPDWEKTFFTCPVTHKPGQVFSYCTTATTMLCTIIKRVTGHEFMDVLRPVFDEIGISEEAYCVETPCGHEWGGSGVCLTAHEFLKFACLLTNMGNYKGKQLIPDGYLREATKKQIDNSIDHDHFDTETGYGYQFWPMRRGFALHGMGGQFALCLPEEGLTLITNAYDALAGKALLRIFDSFWPCIVDHLSNEPLAENKQAHRALLHYAENLRIPCPMGEKLSPIQKEIDNVTYRMDENSMGIQWVQFHFAGNEGEMHYENTTGKHTLRFGICKQMETVFPEAHYYGRRIGFPANREYNAFISAAWASKNELRIECHIVDIHLANLRIAVSFDEGCVTLLMRKHAEWFMNEYAGFASGKAE